MFTVVDHVLLRPVPYLDADRLVTIQETDGSTRNWEAPWIDIDQWRVQSRSFSQIEFSGKMSAAIFSKVRTPRSRCLARG